MLYPALQLIGAPSLGAADPDRSGHLAHRIKSPPLSQRDTKGGCSLGCGERQGQNVLAGILRPSLAHGLSVSSRHVTSL
jgi:hypothetical protein